MHTVSKKYRGSFRSKYFEGKDDRFWDVGLIVDVVRMFRISSFTPFNDDFWKVFLCSYRDCV